MKRKLVWILNGITIIVTKQMLWSQSESDSQKSNYKTGVSINVEYV